MSKSKIKMNFIHFKVLVKRYYELIFNDKVSALMLCLQAPLMLIVISLVVPRNAFSTVQQLGQNGDNAFFIMVVIASFMGLLNSYREVSKERDIFIREYDSGLDATAYILSKVYVLGTICVVQSILLVAGSYLIIDFPTVTPVLTHLGYWFTIFFVMFTSMATGIFISCILKSSDSAVLPVLMLIIIQVVLSGIMIPLEGTLELVSTIVVSRWGLSALGQVFNRNAMFDGVIPRTIYNESLLVCYIVMAGICLLLITISIMWLKKSYSKASKKNK